MLPSCFWWARRFKLSMTKKPLVVIESPFGSKDNKVLMDNIAYARKCISDSIKRGEAPFASHMLYPGSLDDLKPEERKLGMECGFAWGEKADKVAVYVDRGISDGMVEGIKRHEKNGLEIEYRSLKVTL
jgi:hypothetical protein